MSETVQKGAPPGVARLLLLALALGAIWGHYTEVGTPNPDEPSTLLIEREGRVFGVWPYFQQSMEDGFALRLPGLLIGIVSTGVAVLLTLHFTRSRSKARPQSTQRNA